LARMTAGTATFQQIAVSRSSSGTGLTTHARTKERMAFQLSVAALAEPMISAGVMTAGEAARLAARPADPDFLGCGFAFIGAWGKRPGPPA
jgi:hypothetical protein